MKKFQLVKLMKLIRVIQQILSQRVNNHTRISDLNRPKKLDSSRIQILRNIQSSLMFEMLRVWI